MDKPNSIINIITLEISTKSSAFAIECGCGKSTIFQLFMRLYDLTWARSRSMALIC